MRLRPLQPSSYIVGPRHRLHMENDETDPILHPSLDGVSWLIAHCLPDNLLILQQRHLYSNVIFIVIKFII